MVRLHVKRGDESQFLFDASVDTTVDEAVTEIAIIYNGRLKISRVCMEMEELANHGTMLPPNMMGLTDEQVEELKLVDEWADICVPSGGWTFNKDDIGRRNGRQPNDKMQDILRKTVEEAKAIVSKKQVQSEVAVTRKMVQEALDILRGAVTIVYPMGLPPYDSIRQEFENTEDLTGTQASLEVIEPSMASLWFSGKEMQRAKKLSDFLGRNEKTRAVVKLQKIGQGAPGREPVMTEAEQKDWMLHAYRRQEDLKVNDSNNGTVSHSSSASSEIAPPVAVESVTHIEPKQPTHRLLLEDNQNTSEEDSDAVFRIADSVRANGLPVIRHAPGDAPLTAITSSACSSDYSIFQLLPE